MKELNRKVFLTIYGMLSLFLVISLVIINVQSYRREYESVSRNLNMRDRGEMSENPGFPFFSLGDNPRENGSREEEDKSNTPELPDFENMMIIDYEVYTAELKDGKIDRIISHGNESSDFDEESIAESILTSGMVDTTKISNLYAGGYSYNYRLDSITILNNRSVSGKLWKLLLETILLFIVLEVVIYFISKLVTGWITKPAKEAFVRQREFISDASHELKTPLAVIMASSDELKADGTPETNLKYIENIKYESDRMNKLISGLLDLSKLEERKDGEGFKEEKLSRIVEKTALVFEGVAFESGVEIETDIEEDISLNCCKEDIEKLVSTLLDNAIKHSYKDTKVRVKLYKSKGVVVLKIINTGDPIQPGDEEKIFERFYRADKARSRSENRYGLGLAIAKRIVTNHRGTIKASSSDGDTVFRVELPIT